MFGMTFKSTKQVWELNISERTVSWNISFNNGYDPISLFYISTAGKILTFLRCWFIITWFLSLLLVGIPKDYLLRKNLMKCGDLLPACGCPLFICKGSLFTMETFMTFEHFLIFLSWVFLFVLFSALSLLDRLIFRIFLSNKCKSGMWIHHKFIIIKCHII